MLRKVVASLAAGSLLAGCATAPSKISASYVSPMLYSDLDCRQLRMEMLRVETRVNEVTGAQQTKANNDAWAMGVGLVLFWPALFFLAHGEDQRAELASLKGKYDAINETALQRKCGMGGEAVQAQAALPAQPDPRPGTPSTVPAAAPATNASREACGVVRQKNGTSRLIPC